jgi:hypothetical protein
LELLIKLGSAEGLKERIATPPDLMRKYSLDIVVLVM